MALNKLQLYLFIFIAACILLNIPALPIPDHETSSRPTLDVDANIDFSSYPSFSSLKSCLRSFFGGPGNGGAENQVAKNVECVANSCLCTPKNIEENLLHISSQVKEICAEATNVKKRVAQAASVLSGYCSMVTAGLTTTTLGGGPAKPTSTFNTKPKGAGTTDSEPYPLPNDPKDEEPSKGAITFGALSLGAFLGIVISAGFGLIATIISVCALHYQRDAQRWRNSRP